jgi:hypothetical protein
MRQHMAVEPVDDDIEIAVDEFARLVADLRVGGGGTIFLDERDGAFDHGHGLVLRCRRGSEHRPDECHRQPGTQDVHQSPHTTRSRA